MSSQWVVPDSEKEVKQVETENKKKLEEHSQGNKIKNEKRQRKRSQRKIGNKNVEIQVKRKTAQRVEWRKTMGENKYIEELKAKYENKKSERQKKKTNEWWGDDMTNEEQWPVTTGLSTIRIYGQNLNGVSKQNEYVEWELMLDHLDNMQVDIACLTEINLDITKPAVKYNMIEKMKKMDKNAQIVFAGSKTAKGDSEVKRGGTAILVRGSWAGRIIKKGSERLGRWAYIEMIGKKNKRIKIYTMYRVCPQRHAEGTCTIYMQQELDLLRHGRKLYEPREAILQDLLEQIEKYHGNGIEVMILGDTNEDIVEG